MFRDRALAGALALATMMAVAPLLVGATTTGERTCSSFATRAEAQVAHDNGSAAQKSLLDPDRNGIACDVLPTSVDEGLYQVTRDIAAGTWRTPGPTGPGGCYRALRKSNTGGAGSIIDDETIGGQDSVTFGADVAFVQFRGLCVWTLDGNTPTNPNPPPSTSGSTSPTPTSSNSSSATATSTTGASTTATSTAVDDRDCDDFRTQAEAQAALSADATDPDNLDADDDGTACEDSFGTDGQQVSVVPVGGVATGGLAES